MAQNDQKLSGPLHHMVSYMAMIFGTHVRNDDISRCFFHVFKILIFDFLGS